MELSSTAPQKHEFNTVPTDDICTHKNQKVIGLLASRSLGYKDSSMNSDWRTIDDYLSLGIGSLASAQKLGKNLWVFRTTPVLRDKSAEEIISAYRSENIVHHLDINELFVKEYTHHTPVKLLHSLVDIGKTIFKDARPTDEVEARIINNFVRSKAKVLSSKDL